MDFKKMNFSELIGEVERLNKENDELKLALVSGSLLDSHSDILTSELKLVHHLLTKSKTDFIWVIDLKLKTIYVSPNVHLIMGNSVEEQLRMPFHEKFTPESVQLLMKIFNAELEKDKDPQTDPNRSIYLEAEYVRKDGSKFWAEMTVSFLRDEFNQPIAVQGISRDISERKNAEQEIISIKNTYVEIINSISEAIYVQDENGIFIDINKGTERLYGCDRDDIIGKTPRDVAAPGLNDIEHIEAISKEVFITGVPARFDLWAIRKNGEIFPKEVIVNKGKYFGKDCLIASARDITERKNLENSLKQKDEQFFEITKASPDALIISTIDAGRVLYINEQGTELLGASRSYLFENSTSEIYLDKHKRNELIKLLKKGPVNDYELQIRNFKGEIIWIELNSHIGTFRGIPAIYTGAKDITERKLIKDQLNATLKRNAAILQAIPDMLFVIDNKYCIHDFHANNISELYLPPSDFLGKYINEVLPEDVAIKMNKCIDEVFASGEQTIIYYELDINNSKAYFESRYVKSGDNEVLSIVRNITEKRKSQIALKESHHIYQSLLNSMSELVFIKDSELKYIFANTALCNYMGLAFEDIIGKTDNDLMPPEEAKYCIDSDTFAFNENKTVVSEEINKGRIIETHKFPVMIGNNQRVLGSFMIDVTEQRSNVERLIRSEEMFRLITENIIDGIIVFQNGQISYLSPSYEMISGHLVTEELGKDLDYIKSQVHPDDVEKVFNSIFEAAQNGIEGIKYQFRALHKKGYYYWREDYTRFVYNADGSILKTYTTARDITELKEYESQLSKLSLAIEQSPVSFVITDINGNIEYVNPHFLEFTGYSYEEVIGKNPRFLKSGWQPKSFYKEFWDTILSGKIWKGEFHNKKKNGELFWEFATISPMFDSNGKITSFIAFKEDITQSKLAKEKLIESEKRYSELAKQSRTFAWEVDDKGIYQYVSPVIEQVLGYKPEEIINKLYYYDLCPVSDREEFVNSVTKMFENKNILVNLENKAISKSGEMVWLNTNGMPLIGENGELIGYRGSNTDITVRKLADEKLKESESHFRSLFQNAADAIFIADENTGIILNANKAASELIQLPVEQIIGMHQTQLHPEKIKDFGEESFIDHREELKQSDSSTPLYTYVERADGSVIDIEAVASSVVYEGKRSIMGIFRDISFRKQAEMEIINAKENAEINSAKVSAVIENTTSSIWAFDKDYNIIYINKVFQDDFFNAFGVLLEPGISIVETLPSFLSDFWKQKYDRVLNNEQFLFEQIVPTDKGTIYIEVSMNPILKDGEVIGGSCFGSDITPRKLIEKELQYQNSMQNILVNIASRYININSDDFDFSINKSLEEIGRFTESDRVYIFDYDWDLQVCNNTHEWCAEGVSPQIDELQGVPLSMMTWWVELHKKGEQLYIVDVLSLDENDGVRILLEPQGVISLLAIPLMSGNDCIGFIGFDSVNKKKQYTDNEQILLSVFAQKIVSVKNRLILETALIDAKEIAELNEYKVRSMFDNSRVGFMYFDEKGNVIEANPATLKMLGSPSLDATRKINVLQLRQLIEVGFSDNVIKCINEKRLITAENRYVSKWGKESYISYYLIPIIKKSKLIGVWANFQDLTDLWRTQRDLIAAKEKAEEGDRLKTAFLQNVSHEIRTPINGILGFSKLLTEYDITDEEKKEYGEILNHSCTRLINTIDDIIDISRLDTMQVKVNKSNFLPMEIIYSLQESYQGKFWAKGVEFVVNIDPESEYQTIINDERSIYQILNSFLSNAEKFTNIGTVELGFSIKNQLITFYVKDTGIGIKPEDRERIFDRFYQADISISRGFEGSGLGLSIAKGLSKLLGGEIWVESELNEGSTFYLRLQVS